MHTEEIQRLMELGDRILRKLQADMAHFELYGSPMVQAFKRKASMLAQVEEFPDCLCDAIGIDFEPYDGRASGPGGLRCLTLGFDLGH